MADSLKTDGHSRTRKALRLCAAAALALPPLALAGCYAETGREPVYVPKTRALELHRDAAAAAVCRFMTVADILS